MLFNFKDFLDNKIGITTDEVGTGAYSDFITVTRELTDYEKMVMQKGVDEGYRTFTTKAAQGRGMSVEALQKVAEGRVWTGAQAMELGLVDVLGSYEDAIELAAQAAALEDYGIRIYPQPKPFFEKLVDDLSQQARNIFVKDHILAPYEEKLKALKQLEGIQARMPGELEIR
jgi:protease-4